MSEHKHYIVFLFCLLVFQVYGQKFKLLQGQVRHPELSVAQIHVVNSSRGNAEVTDVDGKFEISIKVGERLRFSGVQFKSQEIEISETIFEAAQVTIYLEAKINQLDEVIVKPHRLSGNLSQDVKEVEAPINFHDVGIPGFRGQRKERIVPGKSLILSALLLPISGGVNLDAVYKHLSGYYKSLKKKRQLDVKFGAIYEMIRFYGVLYFTESLNLDMEQVYDFVLACAENTPIIEEYKKGRHDRVLAHFMAYKESYDRND